MHCQIGILGHLDYCDEGLDHDQLVIDNRGPGGLTATDPIWLPDFRINELEVDDYRAGNLSMRECGRQGLNTEMQLVCDCRSWLS